MKKLVKKYKKDDAAVICLYHEEWILGYACTNNFKCTPAGEHCTNRDCPNEGKMCF